MTEFNFSSYINHLKEGGVLVYPTETLYGLGALANDEAAVKKVFEIKKRDQGKPLSILVSSLEMLLPYIEAPNDLSRKLIEKYWPGPLTLLFKYKGGLAPSLNCLNDKIAARISSHELAQCLVQELGSPLTTTSANLSGEDPLFELSNFKNSDRCHPEREPRDLPFSHPDLLVLDGGVLPQSLGSTIVDASEGEIKILRQGDLNIEL